MYNMTEIKENQFHIRKELKIGKKRLLSLIGLFQQMNKLKIKLVKKTKNFKHKKS